MEEHPRKIFCIGFHKTGTTSLYSALTMLGYKVCGTIAEDWNAGKLLQNGARHCIRAMADFDAAEDMPWPLFFRELDEAFPGSKFILTIREPESWYQSLDRHFGHQTTEMNAFVYGPERARARDNKDHWITTYQAHNAAVRAYFKERPDDLLEMALASGDGFERLCPFLGIDTINQPFPCKNTNQDRRSLAYRLKRKMWILAGRTPYPERLV